MQTYTAQNYRTYELTLRLLLSNHKEHYLLFTNCPTALPVITKQPTLTFT